MLGLRSKTLTSTRPTAREAPGPGLYVIPRSGLAATSAALFEPPLPMLRVEASGAAALVAVLVWNGNPLVVKLRHVLALVTSAHSK